jgi:hypothetical protein
MRKPACFLLLFVCGCSALSPSEKAPVTTSSSRARELIVGRWEGNTGGVEFTPSGTAIMPGPHPSMATYRFVDDTSIDMIYPTMTLHLVQVNVTPTDLSFQIVGRDKANYHRVQQWSPKILLGPKVTPTGKGRPGHSAKTP